MARLELANPEGRLRPGMFATVHLQAAASEALSVPTEAVIRTGRRAIVMVAGEGGRFQPVEVAVGRESAGRIEVKDGLIEGQNVVTSGQFLLDSEASLAGVEVKPLPASPNLAPKPLVVRRLERMGDAR
jgi:membrane fusion protein, copper/silver efflux system